MAGGIVYVTEEVKLAVNGFTIATTIELPVDSNLIDSAKYGFDPDVEFETRFQNGKLMLFVYPGSALAVKIELKFHPEEVYTTEEAKLAICNFEVSGPMTFIIDPVLVERVRSGLETDVKIVTKFEENVLTLLMIFSPVFVIKIVLKVRSRFVEE